MSETETYSGGCQCGAVRFRVTGPIIHASVCNCRMCQKAFGNFFAPFAHGPEEPAWTRGRPAIFKSSERVERGFCRDCGTPLTYKWGDDITAIAIGAFDKPDAIMPNIEYAREARHPILADLDSMTSEPFGATDEERDILAILKSNQHPDYDTEEWTPGGGEGQ